MGHCVAPASRGLLVVSVVFEYGWSSERERDKRRVIHSEKRAMERDKEGKESRVPCRG